MFINDSRSNEFRIAVSFHRNPCVFVVMALMLFLLGCSQTGVARQSPLPFGVRSTVEFSVSSNLNQNFPLAFDLLVVYDEALLGTLETMDADSWFEERDQLLQLHSQQVEVHQWEWVPGQSTTRVELHFRRNVRGGVAFAKYQSVGDHRMSFDPRRDLLVTLGEKDWTLAQ